MGVIYQEGTINQNIADVSEACIVHPVSAYMSTNLNNKNKTFKDVADRILHHFGYPSVSVTDVHRDQVYDAIAEACERYTRYAGFSKEFMVIDSRLYEPNHGIRLDHLYTISSIENDFKKNVPQAWINRGPDHNLQYMDDVYVVTAQVIDKSFYFISDNDYKTLIQHCTPEEKPLLETRYQMSHRFPSGIKRYDLIDFKMYKYFIDGNFPINVESKPVADDFKKSKDLRLSVGGTELEKEKIYENDSTYGWLRNKYVDEHGIVHYTEETSYDQTYDYDLMDYRKVVEVVGYTEGSSRSMTSLFSFESALATQTYFTYQFSLRGFDMVSWYAMHEWRKTREKMLAVLRDWNFNPYTQYLTFSPQPKIEAPFMGVIECYVELPLKVIITSPWVQDYATAVIMEDIGMVRGRWGDNVSLPGGGALTGNALATEGRQRQKELLDKLEKSNGYGEQAPCRFFIG